MFEVTAPKRKIILIGKYRSGKDFIAASLPHKKVNFAQGIYEIVNYFYPNCNKSVPGYRRMLQIVGQWGRGFIDDSYPLTPERACFENLVRSERTGKWADFGNSENYWTHQAAYTIKWQDDGYTPLITTDHRFPYEWPVFQDLGYERYLVMCSDETRQKRCEDMGEPFDHVPDLWTTDWFKALDSLDVSEKYSSLLTVGHYFQEESILKDAPDLDERHVIWSDHKPVPKGRGYLTVEEFTSLVLKSL
jgi:hypothetical protein